MLHDPEVRSRNGASGWFRVLRLLVFLALGAPPAAAQAFPLCDCDGPDAPCGNGQPTALPGGCLNSTGGKGVLHHMGGSLSVASDDFVLGTHFLPPDAVTVVAMSQNDLRVPFGDGLRCIGGAGAAVYRFPIAMTDFNGRLELGPGIAALSAQRFPPAGHIAGGQTWNFQALYRDPTGPCSRGVNLTNGLAVVFAP